MRRKCFIGFLLFCSLILLISCSNAKTYYDEGNYTKALELLKEKKGLSLEDYFMKINCFINLGRKSEARESIMLYLLMSDSDDVNRSFVVDLYPNYDFSNMLNLILLKDSDGIKAQILRYISYAELKDYDKAKAILSDYLATQLNITQFATLLIAHPVDFDYIFSFFNAWHNSLSENDKSTYYGLFFYYIKNDLSNDLITRSLNLLNLFKTDTYFNDPDNMKLLISNIDYLREKLNVL